MVLFGLVDAVLLRVRVGVIVTSPCEERSNRTRVSCCWRHRYPLAMYGGDYGASFESAPLWNSESVLWHAPSVPSTLHFEAPVPPISGLAFDTLEERLWLTDSAGFLVSYALPSLQLYSSSRVAWPAKLGEEDAKWGVVSRLDTLKPQCTTR